MRLTIAEKERFKKILVRMYHNAIYAHGRMIPGSYDSSGTGQSVRDIEDLMIMLLDGKVPAELCDHCLDVLTEKKSLTKS